jgi:hypothetical protein
MHGVIGKLATDSLPGTYRIGRLSGIAKDIRGGIRGHITSGKQADKLKADADLTELAQTLRKEIEEYEKSISSTQDRELFATVAGKFDALLRTAEGIRPLSMAGKTDDALRKFRAETMPAYQQVQKASEGVYAFSGRTETAMQTQRCLPRGTPNASCGRSSCFPRCSADGSAGMWSTTSIGLCIL